MGLFGRKRLIVAMLASLMVCALAPVAFAEEEGIGAVIAPIMEEYGLNLSNFAMGYWDLYTGEEWYFNRDGRMIGGSVYKLPLCMMYEERVNAGELTMDSIIGGYTLEKAMYLMLAESNNDVAAAFEEQLGSSHDFRRARVKYFGVEPDALPEGFLEDNYFTAGYSISMLRYLYENSDHYSAVLSDLRQAQPGKYFRAEVDEYEVAHKYGYFEGYLNDVGIIYTPHPYLLAVYTYQVDEALLGRLCRAATDYTLRADAAWKQPEETLPPADDAPSPGMNSQQTPVLTENAVAAHPRGGARSMMPLIILSAAALLLIGFIGAVRALKRKAENGKPREKLRNIEKRQS